MTTTVVLNSHLITKRSSLTGDEHTFLLWMREEQWQEIQPFLNGGPAIGYRRIEEILPDHSPEEREFLINGSTTKERREAALKELKRIDRPPIRSVNGC